MNENKQELKNELEGVIKTLAELPPNTIINETALAKIFKRHPVSIKRAVEREELPPPVKFFGEPSWTVGNILKHFDERLSKAKENAAAVEKRLSAFSTRLK